MSLSFFIEPLDVLYLRGNKLFGEPGSYGESLIPPWPSVAAGAIRSALLVQRGYNLSDYAEGRVTDDAELGAPAKPGTFALAEFQLARRLQNGTVERLFPLPADLSVVRTEDNGTKVRQISPEAPANELQSSSSTMHLAVLPETTRGKPETGYWLPESQWESYLRGESVDSEHLVHSHELWAIDERVGVGLDPATRRAADGQLFTVQAIAMHKMGAVNPTRDLLRVSPGSTRNKCQMSGCCGLVATAVVRGHPEPNRPGRNRITRQSRVEPGPESS